MWSSLSSAGLSWEVQGKDHRDTAKQSTSFKKFIVHQLFTIIFSSDHLTIYLPSIITVIPFLGLPASGGAWWQLAP